MKIPIYQVDAFAKKVFKGNQAAVCPLQDWLPDNILQSIAAENNVAETAFFVKKDSHFNLRWFTPATEVDLCGHATLASAHVLFNHLNYSGENILFETLSGQLTISRHETVLSMDFPSRKPVAVSSHDNLNKALNARPIEVLKARDYLAIFATEEEVAAVKPDFNLIAKLDTLGVIISAPGNNCDFVSRFFAPKVGVPEDPVTGSAHTTLIPYWSEKLARKSLHAFQISQRGGEIFCSDEGPRVRIAGNAVTFLIGEIEI